MTTDLTFAPTHIPAQLPAAVQAELQAMGPVVAPQPTEALFAPLHSKAVPQDVRIERDVPYGPDARNRLDIFTPLTGTGPLPVLLFVHGGAFMRGDRRIGDGTCLSRQLQRQPGIADQQRRRLRGDLTR